MEQLTIFDPPYTYLIDASSVLAQKEDDLFPRRVHKSLWRKIEALVEEKRIVTCSEIDEEVSKDDVVGKWFCEHHCVILPIDDTVQNNVRRIVTEYPRLIEFASSGTSSGDAFLIATAMKYQLTIITEENKDRQNKIPYICRQYGVKTLSITNLCKEEDWSF